MFEVDTANLAGVKSAWHTVSVLSTAASELPTMRLGQYLYSVVVVAYNIYMYLRISSDVGRSIGRGQVSSSSAMQSRLSIELAVLQISVAQ